MKNRSALGSALIVVTFAIVLCFLLFRLEAIAGIVMFIVRACSALIWGAVLAFILNVPMRLVERLLTWLDRKKCLPFKARRALSMLITIVAMISLIYLLLTMIVPELVRTIRILLDGIPVLFRRADELLKSYNIDLPDMLFGSTKLDTKSATAVQQQLQSTFNLVMSGVSISTSIVSNTFGAVMDVFFSVLFALYILASKEQLGVQLRKMLYAFLPERFTDRTLSVLKLASDTYSSFIGGQCAEALILGGMFFICMSLFRMPYALLISVCISVTALIPLIGAWAGFIIGTLLILISDPITALWFAIMFLILQQIEGNLIYPHVVGNSIGLKPIWTLVAVVIGQALFGILGMLLFIPLASVIYTLLKQSANARLSDRGISPTKYI